MASLETVQNKGSETSRTEALELLHKILQVIRADLENERNSRYAHSVLERVGLGAATTK